MDTLLAAIPHVGRGRSSQRSLAHVDRVHTLFSSFPVYPAILLGFLFALTTPSAQVCGDASQDPRRLLTHASGTFFFSDPRTGFADELCLDFCSSEAPCTHQRGRACIFWTSFSYILTSRSTTVELGEALSISLQRSVISALCRGRLGNMDGAGRGLGTHWGI